MTPVQGQRILFARGPRLTLETFDVPVPGPRQVLVRITRSQVSAGSEMNYLRFGPAGYGKKGDLDATMAIGYQAVGRVEAIGTGIADFKVGDRVLTGGVHGTHWLVDCALPEPNLEHIPDNVSDEAAGFANLGDVALHGVRRARLQIDESVAVFGMGIVGQMALQFARCSGAYPLIAVDLSEERLAKARLSGASHTINASCEDAAKRIREITGGAGAEAVFHCTPVASILQGLLTCAADRGKIILTGSAPGLAEIGLQEDLLRRELTILGTYERGMPAAHPYWAWTRPRNRRACLRLMSSGDLKIDPLITHLITPAEAQATFETMLRGNDGWLGVVIKWT